MSLQKEKSFRQFYSCYKNADVSNIWTLDLCIYVFKLPWFYLDG